jgi:hypothetical protein
MRSTSESRLQCLASANQDASSYRSRQHNDMPFRGLEPNRGQNLAQRFREGPRNRLRWTQGLLSCEKVVREDLFLARRFTHSVTT